MGTFGRSQIAVALAVAVLMPSTAAALPHPDLAPHSPVHAQMRAERDIAWKVDATCDLDTARALATRHPEVRQVVVLATDEFADTFGTAFVAARTNAGWRCQTDTVTARFGRNGTRPLLDRRSGDGTTPAGVFPLGETTAWDGERVNVFGNSADPGVHRDIAYRRVRREDCWGAIPNHPDYNHLVDKPGCSGPDDEWLQRFGDVYSHAAVIGANMDPISGDEVGETPYAAAIFLHRHSYAIRGADGGATKPTSGCVSLPLTELAEMITLLDPALQPHFAIGPTDQLRSDT